VVGLFAAVVVEAEVSQVVHRFLLFFDVRRTEKYFGVGLAALHGLLRALSGLNALALRQLVRLEAAPLRLGLSRYHPIDLAECVVLYWLLHEIDMLYGLLQTLRLLLPHLPQTDDPVGVDGVGSHHWSLEVFNFVEDGSGVSLATQRHLWRPLDKIVVVLVHNKNY